MNGNATSNG